MTTDRFEFIETDAEEVKKNIAGIQAAYESLQSDVELRVKNLQDSEASLRRTLEHVKTLPSQFDPIKLPMENLAKETLASNANALEVVRLALEMFAMARKAAEEHIKTGAVTIDLTKKSRRKS